MSVLCNDGPICDFSHFRCIWILLVIQGVHSIIYTCGIRYSSTRRQIRHGQSELGDAKRYEYCQHDLLPDRWSNIENQQDATITIYWSPISVQHVSGKLLPIFRSARLRLFTAYGIVSCCGRQGFGERQRGTMCTVWRKLLDSFIPYM